MTQDTRRAFAHPEERAAATAGAAPRDRISLRDHVVSADIGAFQVERGAPQRLRFNVVVEVIPADPSDDVDAILSYDRISEAIVAELARGRVDLLETLAEGVAARILTAPQALRVFVRVEKLDRGPGALGVEIARDRGPAPAARAGGEGAVRPCVVHLSNAAIAEPGLTARLDTLRARGAPLALCVGLPDTLRPRAREPKAQQCIDLLAIEQNAWVLAARVPPCTVVQSRTEIDWALRHDRLIVWAPAKLVLNAANAPQRGACDAPALSQWLAETLDAAALVLVGGGSVASGGRVPVEAAPL